MNQPNDYPNTPEDYSGPREMKHNRMSETRWVQTAIARLVVMVAAAFVFGLGVYLAVHGATGLWVLLFEGAK